MPLSFYGTVATVDSSTIMDIFNSDIAAQQTQFIQRCAGFAAGATVAVILRLFARWHKSISMGYDEYAIILSLIPLWALAGTGIGIARFGGLAQDAPTLTSEQSSIFYPSAFVSYILYGLAISAAKISILLLYRRIFTASPFRRTIDFFMVVCTVWCILVVFLAIFRCNPIAAAWSGPDFATDMSYAAPATCIPIKNLYYGTSTSNLFLDIVINLLPARQIWALQMPFRQRILLTLCLCLGVISIAAGIGRIITIPDLLSDNLPASIATPYLFVIIEPSFAITCACLPTYRPLAIWAGQRISTSLSGSRIKSLFPSSANSSNAINSASSSSSRPSLWRHRASSWFGQKQQLPSDFHSGALSMPASPGFMGEKRNLLSASVESTPMSSPQVGSGAVVDGHNTAGAKTEGSENNWSER